TSRPRKVASTGRASCVMNTRTSPWLRDAARFRVAPWLNDALGISVTSQPNLRASEAVPSTEEESTTTISSGASCWPRRLSISAGKYDAALSVGTRTEMRMGPRLVRARLSGGRWSVKRNARHDGGFMWAVVEWADERAMLGCDSRPRWIQGRSSQERTRRRRPPE